MLFICYPKCTTCKKARDYLDKKGVSYTMRDIKAENPSFDELEKWARLGNIQITKLFNTSGLIYRSLGLKDKLGAMTDKEKLELLATDGMLVKRPLLIDEDKERVCVGFREKEWEATL